MHVKNRLHWPLFPIGPRSNALLPGKFVAQSIYSFRIDRRPIRTDLGVSHGATRIDRVYLIADGSIDRPVSLIDTFSANFWTSVHHLAEGRPPIHQLKAPVQTVARDH